MKGFIGQEIINVTIPFLFRYYAFSNSLCIPAKQCMNCHGDKCEILNSLNNSIKSLTIELEVEDCKFTENCLIFNNLQYLKLLIDRLEEKGLINIWILKNKYQKIILRNLQLIPTLVWEDSFYCNKGFSELFPTTHPMAIYYYYSRYNRKNALFRILIYLVISFRLTHLFFKFQNPVRLFVYRKNG
jgi:hypothetical protein